MKKAIFFDTTLIVSSIYPEPKQGEDVAICDYPECRNKTSVYNKFLNIYHCETHDPFDFIWDKKHKDTKESKTVEPKSRVERVKKHRKGFGKRYF